MQQFGISNGSTHVLDSELPTLYRWMFSLYLLATYIRFLFLIVAVLWNSYWHLCFFPLGLDRFGLLKYRENCLYPRELSLS